MHSALASSKIQAKNYTNASRTSAQMKNIFIHTMESPEGVTTAEDVTKWAAGPTAPNASWHYGVDSNSVVCGVEEEDIAWAAGPTANARGVHIELAGKANQTPAQWADAFSRAELVLAARLVADICKRRGITAVHLSNAQLAAGARGVAGHVQASQVWHESDHTDPGVGFPWAGFIGDVKAFLDNRKWQYRLIDAKGNVFDRSTIVRKAGLPSRLVAFTTRVAPKFTKMLLSGKGPRIRAFRVA